MAKHLIINTPKHVRIRNHSGKILLEAFGDVANSLYKKSRGNSSKLLKTVLVENTITKKPSRKVTRIKESYAKNQSPTVNYHIEDYGHLGDFGLEWDVKDLPIPRNLEDFLSEYADHDTSMFAEMYCQDCFDDIKREFRSKEVELKTWALTGRSGGWFVLVFKIKNALSREEEFVDAADYEALFTEKDMDLFNKHIDAYAADYHALLADHIKANLED